MPDAFSNVENTVEDTIHNIEQDVKDYFYGSSNYTTDDMEFDENGNPIYPEDPEDTDCGYLMHDDIMKYWNTVFAMMGLFVAAFVVPYVLCCCGSRWPRCASKWFFWIGVTQWVCGALLASSVLMPNCLHKLCGEHFCSAHKYNPGQVWGGVVIGLGCILQIKSCALWRAAKRLENEKNMAAEAEKGALVSTIDTMMDDSERGTTTTTAYKDRPDFPDNASSDFPDNKLV